MRISARYKHHDNLHFRYERPKIQGAIWPNLRAEQKSFPIAHNRLNRPTTAAVPPRHGIAASPSIGCRGALNFDQSCALNNDQGT